MERCSAVVFWMFASAFVLESPRISFLSVLLIRCFCLVVVVGWEGANALQL